MPYFVLLEMPYLFRKKKKPIEDLVKMAKANIGNELARHKLEFVDIDLIEQKGRQAALQVTDWTLLGFQLSFKVKQAESPEHAEAIAKKMIGRCFPGTPLTLLAMRQG